MSKRQDQRLNWFLVILCALGLGLAAFVVVAIIAIFASFLYQRFLGLSQKPIQ